MRASHRLASAVERPAASHSRHRLASAVERPAASHSRHRLAVALTLLTLSVAGCSVISIDLTPRLRPLVEETVEGEGNAKILLMDVHGFLADEPPASPLQLGAAPPRVGMLVRVREELKKAAADRQVKAVVVRINSPGGTVTASDILFRELDQFRLTSRVPVIAIMMDVAASGGYYVALAADQIVAHPTTVTGSIGVLMLTLNAEGLMEKVGLSAAAIKSGERKDMGSPFRALTDEERKIFQSVIDDLHRQFVAKVAERRKIPLDTARGLADGRIYSAEQARSLRLVDRVGYMPDALEVARRAAGIDAARVIVYHRPREYRATYYARSESGGGLDATVAQLSALIGTGPKFLYLWSP